MPVSASANVTYVLASPGVYNYTVTLTNDPSTTTQLNTLAFSMVGPEGLMTQAPTVTGSPFDWTGQVSTTDLGGGVFAYGIVWSDAPGNFPNQIFAGQSSSAFTFTSTETPAQLAADTPVFAGQSIPTLDSYVGFDGGDWPIVGTISCFREGTHIRTASGERAVEGLRPGDHVITHTGKARPITWIGRRRIVCRTYLDARQVWPVRIAAGALEPMIPAADLFLSPDHAMCLDGVLIPVKYLLNGTTVRQLQVDAVTWYHLELDTHDVILAEGTPVETYLETGGRAGFDPAEGVIVLLPARETWQREAESVLPLVVTGPVLAAVRARLAARAAGVVPRAA